jgi:hypothetical protein
MAETGITCRCISSHVVDKLGRKIKRCTIDDPHSEV